LPGLRVSIGFAGHPVPAWLITNKTGEERVMKLSLKRVLKAILKIALIVIRDKAKK
jgi:hypothetical protein